MKKLSYLVIFIFLSFFFDSKADAQFSVFFGADYGNKFNSVFKKTYCKGGYSSGFCGKHPVRRVAAYWPAFVYRYEPAIYVYPVCVPVMRRPVTCEYFIYYSCSDRRFRNPIPYSMDFNRSARERISRRVFVYR